MYPNFYNNVATYMSKYDSKWYIFRKQNIIIKQDKRDKIWSSVSLFQYPWGMERSHPSDQQRRNVPRVSILTLSLPGLKSPEVRIVGPISSSVIIFPCERTFVGS